MTENSRLASHPYLPANQGAEPRVTILVNGQPLEAVDGDTLAAALWANSILDLRHEPKTGGPRGLYCGIGHCYECRVTVDGVENVRSCLTPVREGMQVTLENRRPGDTVGKP